MSRADLPHPRRLLAVLAGLALLLAACGSDTTDGDSGAVDATTTTETGASSTDSTGSTGSTSGEQPSDTQGSGGSDADDAATTTTAEPTGTTDDDGSSTTAGAATNLALALGPDGLIVVETATGSTTFLDFGTATETVLSALDVIIGQPGQVQEGNPECNNGQAIVVTWDDLITLDFNDEDQFLAWSLRPDSTLTTMAGIGLGSSRSEVDDAIVVTVEESTLGTEFSSDATGQGLGGLFDGTGPDDPVSELWAGSICAFR